ADAYHAQDPAAADVEHAAEPVLLVAHEVAGDVRLRRRRHGLRGNGPGPHGDAGLVPAGGRRRAAAAVLLRRRPGTRPGRQVEVQNSVPRQFVEEHAGNRVEALAAELAGAGEAQVEFLLRPRHADEREPALLLDLVALGQAALVRQESLL